MRNFLASLALCVVLVFTGCKPQTFTPQQKASHMIRTMYSSGVLSGQCTATAIGPHALLTADHCNKNDSLTAIKVDLSTRQYNIVGAIHDGRDHVIYFVDGPEFRNKIDLKTRDAVPGEHVYIYGDGAGRFPSRRLDGVVKVSEDPSDVDEDQGMTSMSLPVVPGDSGSAVYAEDGKVVAVVTYQHTDVDLFGQPHTSSLNFSLAFSDEQTASAKDTEIHKPETSDDPMSFNPFIGLFDTKR